MTEPITTISGAVASGLTAIKDFPLWLLTGIALSLIAFLIVPVLSAAVPQEARKWVILGAGAFTILAACRFGSLVISQINSYRAKIGGSTDIPPDANTAPILLGSHPTEGRNNRKPDTR
jgi:hypothetical protein